MIKHILLLVLILIQIQTQGQSSDFRSEVDSLIQDALKDQRTGLTVGIMHHGEMVYAEGFGKADIELEVSMDANHIFRIGSITKQFTSAAILRLMENDKLSLDDPIQKFIPDYKTMNKTVTIEHLLTHTSGIPSYTNAEIWDQEMRKRDFKPLDLLHEFATDTLEFDPGTQFKYNNTGYFMLGYIIEQISGKTYEDYINEEFFKPLKMESSHYGSNQKIIPMRASGYDSNESGQLVNSLYLSMSQPYSAGSLLSTVHDLAVWNKYVFSHKVISASTLNRAHTPYTLADGTKTGYGYGWGVGEQYGMKTIAHGGGINGYLSMGIYFPHDELYVAVLSNCTCVSPDALAAKIGAAYLGVNYTKNEIQLTKGELEKFVGQYKVMQSMEMNIFLEGDQLMAQMSNQPAVPLFPSSSRKFFLKVVEADIEFHEKNGKVDGLTIFQGGQQVQGVRLQDD